MAKMDQLIQDVRALERKLSACTRCGVCQANCPLFAQTRKEADVSRGKLALLTGLIDGIFNDARGVNERLSRCLLCGSCAKGCPSGVSILEIFISARGIIARYLGLPFGQKLLFKKILADPGTFNWVAKTAASFQYLFFKEEKNIQATSCARFASPLLRKRSLVPLKPIPFHEQVNDLDFRKDSKGIRVAFFVGCLVDKAFPDIAFGVIDCLKHFNARVYLPQSQGCCGIPALSSGDTDTFEALVRLNVDLFSENKIDYLVTACATCSSTIIKLWPALVKDEALKKKLAYLSERTVDISWLLTRRFNVASVSQEKDRGDVTYHDPCHLKKSLDVYEEPRQVIEAAGYRLREMADSDTCCGMGGSFNLKHYDLSQAIGTKKAENIIDTGCSIVATSCPACMMQLSDMLAKQGAQVAVKHPVELFASALRDRS